jgi:hypothetical protein
VVERLQPVNWKSLWSQHNDLLHGASAPALPRTREPATQGLNSAPPDNRAERFVGRNKDLHPATTPTRIETNFHPQQDGGGDILQSSEAVVEVREAQCDAGATAFVSPALGVHLVSERNMRTKPPGLQQPEYIRRNEADCERDKFRHPNLLFGDEALARKNGILSAPGKRKFHWGLVGPSPARSLGVP